MCRYIEYLPEDARPIPGTLNWADRLGNIYGKETREVPNRWHKGLKTRHKHYGEYFIMTPNFVAECGYNYVSLKFITENGYRKKSCRLHRKVAETFLENPNNYPVVGHKNNIKTDNRVDNLYWTTYSENTQKAVDDKLLVNDKGYDDSQSHPVSMFDTYTNKLLGTYGSISIAAEETGLSKTTICRQAKYKRPVRKPFYFRFQDDPSIDPPTIVIQYDHKTDKEVARYWNCDEAERRTGVSAKAIRQQCSLSRKPQWTKNGFYFTYGKMEINV